MGDLVSVIVIDENRSLFRERCLNSVRRQTYAETETMVVTGAGSRFVMEACHKARGEYVFFCSATSIIQENTIEELYRETLRADGSVLMCADIYTRNGGDDYQRCTEDTALYGKLFRKRILSGIELTADEGDMLWRWELLVRYMAGAVKTARAVAAIVYETSPQSLEWEAAGGEKVLEKFYEILMAGNPQVEKTAQLEAGEAEQRDVCIRYTCGFCETRERKSQYLLIKREYPAPQVMYGTEKEAGSVSAKPEELTGAALSEHIVRKFGQGNLGLRTIIRAMAAWLGYKLKAGGQHEKV